MWEAGQLAGKHSSQLIGLAGNGNIHDSRTSQELRDLLSAVELEDLERFAKECLSDGKADNRGLFLQDVVNELGVRLGFAVEFGRYQGSSASPAADGIWKTSQWGFVVEVKTTDAYRISLTRIATYRDFAVRREVLAGDASSALIVVGRQDTGELEAQVRGSKYAWDVRLIGVDSLIKAAYLVRDSVEQESVLDKVRAILRPQEYTRVDGLLDVVFESVKAARDEEAQPLIENRNELSGFPQPDLAGRASAAASDIDYKDVFRSRVVTRFSAIIGKGFRKVRRSLYESGDSKTRVSLAISKNYGTHERPRFWYAFHTTQMTFLDDEASDSWVAFGCEEIDKAVIVPFQDFRHFLPMFNQTITSERAYWHVFIRVTDGRYELHTKGDFAPVDVTDRVIDLPISNPV